MDIRSRKPRSRERLSTTNVKPQNYKMFGFLLELVLAAIGVTKPWCLTRAAIEKDEKLRV